MLHPLATALAARGNQNMKLQPRYHLPLPTAFILFQAWAQLRPPVAFFIKNESQLERNCQQLLRLAPRPCPAWLARLVLPGLACPARFPLAVWRLAAPFNVSTYLTLEFNLVPMPSSVRQCRVVSQGAPACSGKTTWWKYPFLLVVQVTCSISSLTSNSSSTWIMTAKDAKESKEWAHWEPWLCI